MVSGTKWNGTKVSNYCPDSLKRETFKGFSVCGIARHLNNSPIMALNCRFVASLRRRHLVVSRRKRRFNNPRNHTPGSAKPVPSFQSYSSVPFQSSFGFNTMNFISHCSHTIIVTSVDEEGQGETVKVIKGKYFYVRFVCITLRGRRASRKLFCVLLSR